MATFTIDTDNNITAFANPELAEAAVGAGAQAFTSQKELAKLAAWPERTVAVWNSLPGRADKGVQERQDPQRIWASPGLRQSDNPEGTWRKQAHGWPRAPASQATKKATFARSPPRPKSQGRQG